MIDFEYLWKDTTESWPSNIFGFGLRVTEMPPEVDVNTDILYKSFISGFKQYGRIWDEIIPRPELLEA